MSQVKNLRAMFENKGDDPSPPDRGRSPAGFASVSGGSASESPRPLSTVRTNFVAIHEKDGRMGLRRNPSHESGSPYRRPMSTDMETESLSTTAGEDMPKASRRLFANDPIPESPRSSKPAAEETKPSTEKLGAVNDEPSHNPDHGLDHQKSSPALTSAEPTQQTTTRDSALASDPPKAEPKARTVQSKTSGAGITGADKTSKPAKTMPKGPTKTSAAAKPTTSTTKRTDTKPPIKPQQTTKKEAAPVTKPSTSGRKPAPVKVSTDQGTGFVKPKPKSPTKPVALPSSFTAPTASSSSKGGSAKPTASKQTSLQPPAAARAPSRASATGGTRTIRKQPSTINSSSSRPSIGPPPKKAGQDSSSSQKKASHVDEGFLARMMRPTQSSSSKTTEKAPDTPPRKSAARPSTSTADGSSRRASSVKRQAKLKGSVENTVISSNVSEAEPSVVAEGGEEANLGPTQKFAPEESKTTVDKSASSDAASKGDTGLETLTSQLKLDDTTSSAPVAQVPEAEPVPEPKPLQDATAEAVQAETAETVEEAAVETAQPETAEEAADIASEAQGLVQTSAEPIAEQEDSKSSVAEPVEEASTTEVESPTTSVVESQTATQASEQTSEGTPSYTEDGRPSQAAIDEKEEAVVEQMTPPADVIPEETAAVETVEEAVALADAGELIQTPVKPGSPLGGEVTEEITKLSESQDTQESASEKGAEGKDV